MLNTESWISGPHNWLDGRRVRPGDSGLGSFANLSPRTGGLLCEVSSTGEADVDRGAAAKVTLAGEILRSQIVTSGWYHLDVLFRAFSFDQPHVFVSSIPQLSLRVSPLD